MKKLLIYIPTFNRLESLKKCIECIVASITDHQNEVQVIVSDNASTDGTSEYLKSLKYNFLITSRNSNNIGLTRNVLKVFTLKTYAEFTWMIGDDDYLKDDAISRLVNEINTNKEVDFYFLNTLSFPGKHKNVLFKLKKISRIKCIFYRAKSHSKLNFDFLTTFKELFDPRIDHTFIGAVMCYAFRSNLVFDSVSSRIYAEDFSQAEMCYPHTLCYLNSLNPSTRSKHLHSPFTYNFWHEGNDWGVNGHDFVVSHGLGLVFFEALKLGFIKEESKIEYFRSYMAIANLSYLKLLKTYKDFPFDVELKESLFKMLITSYQYTREKPFILRFLNRFKLEIRNFLPLYDI